MRKFAESPSDMKTSVNWTLEIEFYSWDLKTMTENQRVKIFAKTESVEDEINMFITNPNSTDFHALSPSCDLEQTVFGTFAAVTFSVVSFSNNINYFLTDM